METKKTHTPETLMEERIGRVNAAIALKKPDRIPLAPLFAGALHNLTGSCYKDVFYDYDKAGGAEVDFYNQFPLCDAHMSLGFTSGKANEIAGSTMIDWPGKPGTLVGDDSSHQVIEQEYLKPDEFQEFFDDYTGFMLRKYLPRAYPGLKALEKVHFTPTIVLSTSLLAPAYDPEVLKAYETLAEIGKADAEAAAKSAEYMGKLAAIGMPPLVTGASEAPLDIFGDYFRGTLGMLMDQVDHEAEIERACDIFADQQIAALQYFNYVPLPVKRVFFPLHRGMDSFMSPKQYEKLYWKPLKKILMALIDMGVTPYLYSEGKYNTRLEQLTDLPKGKVLIHFEDVDMKEAKRIVGDTACISGNLPIYLLEHGKKQKVIDYCKFLIDTCAPGGGYIFDTNAVCDYAKRENLEAVFETFEQYGKY